MALVRKLRCNLTLVKSVQNSWSTKRIKASFSKSITDFHQFSNLHISFNISQHAVLQAYTVAWLSHE